MFRFVEECVESFRAAQGGLEIDTSRFICLDVTNRAIDGYCYLFFGRSGDRPILVAKLASTPAGKAVFRVEYQNLETLDRIGMNASGMTTPRPLGIREDGRALVTLQAALPGTLMKNLPGAELFSPARVRQSFEQVLQWWERFQDRLGVRRVVLSEDVYDRAVLAEVSRFRRRFLTRPEEDAFLERRFEQRRPLFGLELPFMARHADFCAANIVLGEEGIGVFDWEFPLDHEPPLFDLFFFFSSVRFPFRGTRAESSHFDSFVAVFWEDSYFSREMRRCLTGVCDRYGIPPAALPDLLLLSLIQLANMKFQALVDSHGIEEPEPGTGAVTDEARRELWARFEIQNKNVPFACIRDGALENLRHIVRHGLPDAARLVDDGR